MITVVVGAGLKPAPTVDMIWYKYNSLVFCDYSCLKSSPTSKPVPSKSRGQLGCPPSKTTIAETSLSRLAGLENPAYRGINKLKFIKLPMGNEQSYRLHYYFGDPWLDWARHRQGLPLQIISRVFDSTCVIKGEHIG